MTERWANRWIWIVLIASTCAWIYVLWHAVILLGSVLPDAWGSFAGAPWQVRATIGLLAGVVGFGLLLSIVALQHFDSRADQHTDERRRHLRIVQKGRPR